jgi:hypothetical protein
MPRIRVILPVDLELTPEEAEAARAAADVAKRVRDSGLVGAVKRLIGTFPRRNRPPRR